MNVTGKTIVTSGETCPDGTVLTAEVFIAPGERNYVIVDFSGLRPGQKKSDLSQPYDRFYLVLSSQETTIAEVLADP